MMKKLLIAFALLGAAATSAQAQSFVQIAPVTSYSTINCLNFAKQPDGTWRALNPTPYTLGIVRGIIPTVLPIKTGGFIYNNVDLYSQLELQCGGALVRAKY